MILLIDNYDSFSYNLYQLTGAFDENIKVVRNDELTVEDIRAFDPDHIIISPGPGRPEDAGICIKAVKRLYKEYPILGVCLGHQSICEAFGGKVTYAKKLMHGKQSEAELYEDEIFKGLGNKMKVARYHSLAADPDTLPDDLKVLAEVREDGDREIMAVRHKEYPVYGLQFHPESIMTPEGKTIMENFIKMRKSV